MKITPIPALESNYIWAIQSQTQPQRCYLVDPGEAEPALNYLEQNALTLDGILITHRHYDHVNGIDDIIRRYPCPVFGPKSSELPQVTNTLTENEYFYLFERRVNVLAAPGHTEEHIAFVVEGDEKTPPMAFVGDALFAGGCGNRLLEASIMYNSLQKIAALSPNTLIYCGHEYTYNNLRFALSVEPNNIDLQARLESVKKLQEMKQVTIPSFLEVELLTNPYLRCTQHALQELAKQDLSQESVTPVETFSCIRKRKDMWKP